MIHQETSADSYLFGMAQRLAMAAAEAEAVEPDEAEDWVGRLCELAGRGLFYSSINYYTCVGVRPIR